MPAKPVRLYKVSPADINDLKNITSQALADALQSIIQGAASDLAAYANNIVEIAIEAGTAGDQDTLNQLKDQAEALLEANRLRLVGSTTQVLQLVLSSVINLALQFVAGVTIPGGGMLIPPVSVKL